MGDRFRFRLGNKIKEGRYWEEKQKRQYRLCEAEMETQKHVWEKCREWREEQGSWQEALGWVLEEKGEGELWLRGGRSKRRGKEKGIGKERR